MSTAAMWRFTSAQSRFDRKAVDVTTPKMVQSGSEGSTEATPKVMSGLLDRFNFFGSLDDNKSDGEKRFGFAMAGGVNHQ